MQDDTVDGWYSYVTKCFFMHERKVLATWDWDLKYCLIILNNDYSYSCI